MSGIFHSVQHVRDAGICLVALAVWQTETVRWNRVNISCETGRQEYLSHEVTPELVHIWFEDEPAARATHGFHWGYALQGQPLSVRRKPEAVTHGPAPAPTPSGALLDTSLTVST